MPVQEPPSIVVIAGPTASGKTAVGIDLGVALDGEIVSADSIQVYRYMDVGSAKPTQEERSRVRHHLLDIRDPDQDFSAGDFVKEARACIGQIVSRGRLPVVVGGTGLYIRALLRGIADLPPSDPTLRGELRSEEERLGPGTLFQRLTRVDPDSAAATDSQNLPRIVRALEVFELTGRRLSETQRLHGFGERPYRFLLLCLAPERSLLYERIDTRVESMIKEGLLEEVTRLSQMGYTRNIKSLQSIGYRHAGMILAGEVEMLEGISLMKRDTRHFAKRQFTWFRSEPEVVWCDPHDLDGVRSMVAKFVGR